MPNWTVTRTNDGATIYNKVLSGTAAGPLKITKIVACKSLTGFPSDLKNTTKTNVLNNRAQDLIVVDVTNGGFSPYDKDHSVISGMLRNDLSNSCKGDWDLCAIGILVKTDSTDEVLFTIAKDSSPERIPDVTTAPLLSNYTFNLYIGDDGVSFENLVVDTTGFVSTTLFEQLKGDYLSKSRGGTVTGNVAFEGNVEVADLTGNNIHSTNFEEGGVNLKDKYVEFSRGYREGGIYGGMPNHIIEYNRNDLGYADVSVLMKSSVGYIEHLDFSIFTETVSGTPKIDNVTYTCGDICMLLQIIVYENTIALYTNYYNNRDNIPLTDAGLGDVTLEVKVVSSKNSEGLPIFRAITPATNNEGINHGDLLNYNGCNLAPRKNGDNLSGRVKGVYYDYHYTPTSLSNGYVSLIYE